MKYSEDIERLIKNSYLDDIETSADSDTDERILKDALAAMKKAQKARPTPTPPVLWRIIMRSRITKLAVAAVIIVAAWLGLVFLGPAGGVALAEVLEQIEQINTFAYTMKMTMKNVPSMPTKDALETEMKVFVAKDIGMRMTGNGGYNFLGDTYVLLNENAIVSVMHRRKNYVRIKLTDDALEKIQKENGDPRAILRQFTENEYTELGRSVIDGIEVEGFESNNPAIAENALGDVVGRIWVDVESKLPVRYTIEVAAEDGEMMMDMTVCDFEWGIEIDPETFTLEIPADYKLAAEVELSDEEQFHLEVLGLFAQLSGGRYPSELNVMKIMEEFQNEMITHFGDPMTEPSQPEGLQKMMNLQMVGTLFASLASEDKDLAYHGDIVTAQFPDAVLMRWKTESGKYKVIFGDLSVGEVDAAELEELETASLNLSRTAINPEPADGAEGTALTGLKLTWMPGSYAVAHRVYFGPDPDRLALLGEVTTESAEPATLERRATYYWRIDEVQADGSIATGDLWSFHTGRLVAHWKLDEGEGDTIANSASPGYDGRIIGGPTWAVGKLGSALEFGSDGGYIEITDSNDFAVTRRITVSAWIKTDKIVRQWQAIVTKGDRSWRLQGSRNGYALEFSASGLLIPGNRWGSLYGVTDVNDGNWHHVAGVYDGEKIYLYIDGRVDSVKPASGGIRLDDRQVRIGDNAQHPGRYWNGLIDDVRIYSYGMSPEEVAALAEE
ncbi:MAG: DUF2092 domain-containing protein [Sedimentisphaerales bacterium]|nr:DUF2092 domain-containing protein [Sedimentisphaerales bacterium]